MPLGSRTARDRRAGADQHRPEEALELAVDVVTSHFAWRATPELTKVSLAPGATQTVPVAIEVGPDAWADEPVRITAHVTDTAGGIAMTAASVTPRGDVDPVDPHQGWSVPPSLLGGIDVAALALGATAVPGL